MVNETELYPCRCVGDEVCATCHTWPERRNKSSLSQPYCRFCRVLESHGHFEWCKVTRAPSPAEVMQAVIDEEARCVGGEGPSSGLAAMAQVALATLSAEPHEPQRADEIEALCVRLKSGEYDGADLMRAWIALREYAALLEHAPAVRTT